jgi:hypothetical protein
LKQHISKLFRNQDAFIDEIESYCQFIYMHLKETNFVDYNFKSLNPLILLIYFNKPYILRSVLESFGMCYIPTYSYYGIFEFCLRLQRKECLREIRDYTFEINFDDLKINYHDYNALLQSQDKSNHKLLSLAFQSEQNSITPNFIYMSSKVVVKEYNDISILTLEENRKLNQKESLNLKNYQNRFSSYNFKVKKEGEAGHFVQNVTLPFDLDLSMGSLESINLSNFFSSSPSDELIESDFKFLIQKKWKSLRNFHYFRSISYFFFILIFIFSSVFFKENFALKVLNIMFIVFIILFEVLELLSSSCYDIFL